VADRLRLSEADGTPPPEPLPGAAPGHAPRSFGMVEQAGHAAVRFIGPSAPPAEGAEGAGSADHVYPIPHIRETVATVRQRVHLVLTEWDLPADSLDDVLLVISELTTNAILHALPPAVLRLRWSEAEGHRTLRVEVSDGGPVPRSQWPDEEIEPDEHGRGLGIVTALSVCHGTDVGCEGVTRWADVPVA
jgi:anti-sigma regulatory factor (Ser/Thr protein kinase)